MKKIYNFVVSKKEAAKAERMIKWFSQNVRIDDRSETVVQFSAVLDEEGFKNVMSALRS
jgi:hypothetical protein